MRFALRPEESPARGLVRVMDQEIAKLRELGSREGSDIDRYVHSARVCCKRVRACLRLCRPVLGEETFRAHDRWWRDSSRGLSRLRDLAVRSEALGALASDIAPLAGAGAVESAQVRFAAERLETGDMDESQAIARFARALDHAPRIQRKDLKGAHLEVIVRAMGRTYRDARRAMRSAYEAGDVNRFHDWRKLVKHHALQVRLMRDLFPSLAGRTQSASGLQESLGRLQDVCVVLEGLTQPASRPSHRVQERLRFALQAELARQMDAARAPGEELFAQRRRAFEQKLLKDIDR
jgi:hypothetical protein